LWKFIALYLKLAFPCPVPPACVRLAASLFCQLDPIRNPFLSKL
jgi:hypothetical protein